MSQYRITNEQIDDAIADLDMPRLWLIQTAKKALLDLRDHRAIFSAQHGWVIQKPKGNLVYHFGVKKGKPYWTAESRLALVFARSEDARAIADMIRNPTITVAEKYWS